jgi:N-acetylmuramoyl-L-alanine amidase
MHWIRLARNGGLACLALFAVLQSREPAQRRLSVYSAAANYSIPIVQRDGGDYIGLLELLDPLGTASSKTDGARWRIRFNNRVQADFTAGKDRVIIQGREVSLSGRFLLENDRGLVSVASLGMLAPLLLGGPATLHLASDRMLIGDVGTHFTATIPQDEHPSLVLQFSAAVSPTISNEAGGMRLKFPRDPVVSPASPTLTFGNKAIPSATYLEANGGAEIFIHSTGPLVATVSRDSRTVTVTAASVSVTPSAAPQVTGTGVPPATVPPAETAPAPPPVAVNVPSTPNASQVSRRYFVVLDASHGGDDRGEAISSSLLEKDLNLSFSRRLREQLEKLGITVLTLRESDVNLTPDQRAAIANANHAALYVAVHTSSSGHGVRLFTALTPYESEDRGPFRAWESAQNPFRSYSLIAAAGIYSSLQQQRIPARSLMAPQRPLGNITLAALALEIAPQGTEAAQLASPDYQQTIATAVAAGIASVRDKLGTVP